MRLKWRRSYSHSVPAFAICVLWKQRIKEVLLTKQRSEIRIRFKRSDELEDMEGRLGSCCVQCRNTKEITNHLLPLWPLCTGPAKRICSAQEGWAGKGWALLLTYGKEVGGEGAARLQQGANLPWLDLTLHLLGSSERQQCPQIRNSLYKQFWTKVSNNLHSAFPQKETLHRQQMKICFTKFVFVFPPVIPPSC